MEAREGTCEKAVHETVGMKLQVQWISQEVGDARKLECLLRKAVGHERSQLKRADVMVVISKATGAGLECTLPLELTSYCHVP